MDLNTLRLTYFFHFEKKSIDPIQFNREIIKIVLPTKICNNFHN